MSSLESALSELDANSFYLETRRIILNGYLVLGCFIGLLLAWTLFVPLSSAAIAPGVISVDGYSKAIQHLEGGIIRELLVIDGDKVTAGQAVIKLDDTPAKAEYDSVTSQLILVVARHAKLTAESQQAEQIVFPQWMLKTRTQPDIEKAILEQTESFASRQFEWQQQLSIIDNRIERLNNQFYQLSSSLSSQKKLLSIVRGELKLNQQFLKKGLITRREIFRLQNNEATAEIKIKEKKSQLAAIKQQIGQLQQQKTEFATSNRTKIASQLQADQEQIVKLTHRQSKSRDTLSRTIIKAPVSGTVVNMKAHTLGGVIAPGETILEIVPAGQILLVNAHVEPKDRDIIRPGQLAEVRFTAFSQRALRPIKGKVKVISADRLTDQNTQLPYYLATIELTEDPVKVLNNTPIHPGMQATVMIITGERTAMEYLTKPLFRNFTRAFKEE
jgi:HlyD family type I secretion membrane fusion protein